jgi:hypothetical protein
MSRSMGGDHAGGNHWMTACIRRSLLPGNSCCATRARRSYGVAFTYAIWTPPVLSFRSVDWRPPRSIFAALRLPERLCFFSTRVTPAAFLSSASRVALDGRILRPVGGEEEVPWPASCPSARALVNGICSPRNVTRMHVS